MPKHDDPIGLPHTRGGSTTRDASDLGVPMRPAPKGWEHKQGPEDALDPGPKRGDYSGRLGGTRHHTGEAIYHGPVPQYDTAPEIRAVEQNANVENLVVDDPGGPLDEASPDYAKLKAQRERARRS